MVIFVMFLTQFYCSFITDVELDFKLKDFLAPGALDQKTHLEDNTFHTFLLGGGEQK